MPFTVRSFILFFILSLFFCKVTAQKTPLTPVISPQNIDYSKEITITYDVTGTNLASLTETWLWLWLPDESIPTKTNINPANSNPSVTDKVKFKKEEKEGKIYFTLSLKVTDMIDISADKIKKVGIIIKGNDWANGQSTDFIISQTPSVGEKKEIEPIVDPMFFKADQNITITYDVTGTNLASLTEAWLWLWLPDENIPTKTNINPANSNPSVTDKVKFKKEEKNGKTYFTLSLKITDMIDISADKIKKIGMLIKGNDWDNGQSKDFITQTTQGFALLVKQPSKRIAFYPEDKTLQIQAFTSQQATIAIFIDENQVFSKQATDMIDYQHATFQKTGIYQLEVRATTDAGDRDIFSHSFFIGTPTVTQENLPQGMLDGANLNAEKTAVTFVVTAPNKDHIFVIGDFNQWNLNNDYFMKKSGTDTFWVTVNIEKGKEYIYQYLVDGELSIADPYCELLSSSFDDNQIIKEERYNGLHSFPKEYTVFEASYLKTDPAKYEWKIKNFVKPKKEELVIYELLIRDFTEKRTYRAVIEKLDYLKSLGVNAIELMPVMEFEGNISWGYNTSFLFAPDKYYGKENDLKELIDAAHTRGMAVILDIVLNHHFGRNSMVRLYADGDFGPPTAENPWFNVTPKHDYNVGYDMNHESPYVKKYVDRVVSYWLQEYKIDGYRFDLSKGFTQKNTLGNTNEMGKYDSSRIAILKRIAQKVWEIDADAYFILEHFAENKEEKEFADYGMMLWGNANYTFRHLAKGITDNLSWTYYKDKNWENPHLITYMESHDEERVMWDLSKSSGSFSYKLNRLKMNACFFFLTPGPKMIWQFGEMGYDEELNNDRLGIKPTHWEYLENPERKKLFITYQALIGLKTSGKYIQDANFSWNPMGSLKWINYNNDDVKISLFGNFSNQTQKADPHFVQQGEWYNYFSGEKIIISNPNEEIELQPGEFYLYTSKKISSFTQEDNPIITDIKTDYIDEDEIWIYPNPSKDIFYVKSTYFVKEIIIRNFLGKIVSVKNYNSTQQVEIDISHFPAGIYFFEVNGKISKKKLVIKQ